MNKMFPFAKEQQFMEKYSFSAILLQYRQTFDIS